MKSTSEPPKIEVSVSLNYSTQTAVCPRNIDMEDYVMQVKAEIVGTHWPDDNGPSMEVPLGELSLYLIQVGNAVNDCISLYDVFDVMKETMDAGCAVYDASFRDYNKTIQKMFEVAYCSDDILLLHRLEIHPFARGQKLGLAVLIKAIKDWSSGCSLVLMKPFPLQFEVNARSSKSWDSLALGDFPQKEKQAFQQLRSYYLQLGFEKIGKSEFYALCTHLKWTALEALELPEEFVVPADRLMLP